MSSKKEKEKQHYSYTLEDDHDIQEKIDTMIESPKIKFSIKYLLGLAVLTMAALNGSSTPAFSTSTTQGKSNERAKPPLSLGPPIQSKLKEEKILQPTKQEKTDKKKKTFTNCTGSNTVEECVAFICAKITMKFIALNKPRVGEIGNNPVDMEKLDKEKEDAKHRMTIAANSLLERAKTIGLDYYDNPIIHYLWDLEVLLEGTMISNCAGVSARVLTNLVDQPALREHLDTRVELYAGYMKERGPDAAHSFVRIEESSGRTLICDAWQLHNPDRKPMQSQICDDTDVKKLKKHCHLYQPGLWQPIPEQSRTVQVLSKRDIRNLTKREKAFYKKERLRQKKRQKEINKELDSHSPPVLLQMKSDK